MIFSLFIYILGAFLGIIAFILHGIGFLIPSGISSAITSAIGAMNVFDGIWPVPETMSVIATLVTFFTLWYSAKLIMKLYHMLPFIGKKVKLHGH